MISVIVPVYKVEPYLHCCVDSILAQTYADFELILVDDGSPDNCGAICDSYAEQDARVRVIHQENGGLSAARNAGIEAARGEYLTFIDSDDLITEDCLETLYLTLKKTKADIAVGDMQTFEDGEAVCTQAQPGKEIPTVMSGREACLSIYQMDGKIPVMAWGKLYKTELFAGIRYPVGMIHEDDATTPKLLYRAKEVAQTDNKLYCYRQRQGSIMDTAAKKIRFDGISAAEGCLEFFRKEKDEELVALAQRFRTVVQSKTIVKAYRNNPKPNIPAQYRMSLWHALENIRKWTGKDTYMWYLSLVYPRLVRPYSYILKLKHIFGIERT